MTTEHRCQFCDHVFPGRRRRFCYDCLPAHGEVHTKVYMARYSLLYAIIGVGQKATSSPLPKGHPALPAIPVETPPSFTCVECGTKGQGRRLYCSPRCGRAHVRHGNRAKMPTDVTTRPAIVVVEPGHKTPGKVVATRSDNGKRRDVRALVAMMNPVGVCCSCDGELRPWWTLYNHHLRTQNRCYECYLLRNRTKYARAKKDPRPGSSHKAAIVQCVNCSTPFTRDKYHKGYCSPACKAEGERDKNRRKNARRRGAVQGTPYTLRMVIDRDGCACHLCGRPVDVNLSGSLPKGPSIDHLVPVSAGGADCFTNVALAHRDCNVKRGADGPAQLRLVG